MRPFGKCRNLKADRDGHSCPVPDVYAKGGDYNLDTIVQPERLLVESYGGSIAIIPGVEGRSTTDLINRISQGSS